MDWITREVLTGFQKLLCLGLDRQPAGEVIPGTAQAWVEAITHNREFVEGLDADRFRKAFVTLAATRVNWPAPRDFVDALPAREQLSLVRESRKADPARAAAACAEIAEALSGKMAAAGPDAA